MLLDKVIEKMERLLEKSEEYAVEEKLEILKLALQVAMCERSREESTPSRPEVT